MRVGEADRIDQEFGDVVLLTVRRAAHSKPYVDRLSELLAGSRVRTQGNIAEELAKSLPPSDLLEVIETGMRSVYQTCSAATWARSPRDHIPQGPPRTL